mgnify:CR=1 FL=1
MLKFFLGVWYRIDSLSLEAIGLILLSKLRVVELSIDQVLFMQQCTLIFIFGVMLTAALQCYR